MHVNLPLQNLQLQHKKHHNLGHQQLTNLFELQPELLAQDKTHIINNRVQTYLQIAIKPLSFHLVQ